MPITWPSRVNDQKPIISDLYSRLLSIEQAGLVGSYVGTVAPVLSDFQEALERVTPESAGIPVDAKVQWFDPSLDVNGGIRNLYTKIEDLGVGLSSHIVHPLTPRLAPYGWWLIDYHVVLDDAGAQYDIDISAYDGEIIAFIYSTRNTGNIETDETWIRVNGQAGATYTMQQWELDSAGFVTTASFDQNRWIFPSPGIQSDPIQSGTAWGFLSSLGHANSYANVLAISVCFDDDPPGAGDRVSRLNSGIHEIVGKVANITFGPNAGLWRRGSRIAVFRCIDSALVSS